MKALIPIVALAALAGALTACGPTPNPTPPPTFAPTATATVAPTAAPTATPVAGNSLSGFGDTTANPDTSFACAFDAYNDAHDSIIAYVTVAGSDATTTTSLCGTLVSSSFVKVNNLTTSGQASCFDTTPNGVATIRVYSTPADTGTQITDLCNSLLNPTSPTPAA